MYTPYGGLGRVFPFFSRWPFPACEKRNKKKKEREKKRKKGGLPQHGADAWQGCNYGNGVGRGVAGCMCNVFFAFCPRAGSMSDGLCPGLT